MLSRGAKVQVTAPTQNCTLITEAEMEAFRGMCILVAIHQLHEILHYWSSDPLQYVSSVSQVMSSNKFKQNIETVHVNDNRKDVPRSDPQHDKFHKVWPLIDELNTSISAAYSPSSYASVDESMIPYKVRSSLKQYMPLKPVKRKYKVWCIAVAKTGYVMNFDIHRQTSYFQSSTNLGQGERVVLNLIQNFGQLLQSNCF